VRIPLALLLVVIAVPASARAQTAPSNDGISVVLRELERILTTSDAKAYGRLLFSGAAVNTSADFLDEWLQPGATRAVVKERLRVETPDIPEGQGYDVYIDTLVESGRNGRVGTLLIKLRRDGTDWRIAGLNVLTTIRGLYRLSLTPEKQYNVVNLALSAEDFELRVPSGVAFVAETDAGVTGIVVLGRGEMTFSPTPQSEKGQVRIYSGGDTHQARFNSLYLRAHPSEFDRRLDVTAFHARDVDPRDLRRAESVFQENLPNSYGIELADLSRDKWSVIPKFGDIVSEMQADRTHLTYMKSVSDPEDIRFFDRTRSRTIAIYPSKEKLATRGPFFSEDDHTDFDIVNYDIDASLDPRREWIDGKATVMVTPRRGSITSIILSLAEPLVVRSVISRRMGYLMALRVSGQEDVIINLPQPLRQDELLDLQFTYSGRLPAVPPEREALSFAQGEFFTIQPQPSYIYTGRSRWYPQGEVTDYATATLVLRVPENYSTTASGALDQGYPKFVLLEGAGGRSAMWKEYRFSATQPVRYLGWATSQFVQVDSASFSITRPAGEAEDTSPMTGASYTFGDVHVVSSGMLQRRARELFEEAQRVLKFYGSLLGDIPYQSFTLAVVERNQPGGHSPPYFAALSHPPPATPIAWRTDPAYFEGFPEFFLAHEAAHQWWGQGVGWKNYHEQWISEGFSQYFAALYAEHIKRKSVFDSIVNQMSRWTIDRSDQGPVYLGYRLGHIRNDGRVFRALVYNKGALTLHMLRRLIGDEMFFRGLRRFYSTWRFKKAGTEDVKAAFELEANRDLDRFFDRWIYGFTLPRLKFSYTTEADAITVRFEQIGETFDVPVTVTVEYANSSTDVTVPLTEQVTTRRIPVSGAVRSVEANRDNAAPVVFVK
jgi:Peptidase family M1 domain